MQCNVFGLHTFLQDFLQVDYFPSISVLYRLQTQEELKTLRLDSLFVAVGEGKGRIMSVKILNLEDPEPPKNLLVTLSTFILRTTQAMWYTRARGDGWSRNLHLPTNCWGFEDCARRAELLRRG